jgi:hypothetical protein
MKKIGNYSTTNNSKRLYSGLIRLHLENPLVHSPFLIYYPVFFFVAEHYIAAFRMSSSEIEKRLQDIALVHIPTTDAAEIEERIDQAVNRLQIANEDNYHRPPLDERRYRIDP